MPIPTPSESTHPLEVAALRGPAERLSQTSFGVAFDRLEALVSAASKQRPSSSSDSTPVAAASFYPPAWSNGKKRAAPTVKGEDEENADLCAPAAPAAPIPLLDHTLTLDLVPPPHGPNPRHAVFFAALKKRAAAASSSSALLTIALPSVHLEPVYKGPGGPIVCAASAPGLDEEEEGLFQLPEMSDREAGRALEGLGFDLDKWEQRSWLNALAALDASSAKDQRLTVDAHLSIVIPPPSDVSDPHEIPFQLVLRLSASLLPAAFGLPSSAPLRLLLTHLFPPPAPPADYPGSTTIPYFYASLRPAPAHLALPDQPPELVPDLRPFQRRALGMLMRREEETALDAPGWVRMGQGAAGWYNAISGELWVGEEGEANDGPKEFVRGALLAEEMGLGKTVEVLALVLSKLEESRRWAEEQKLRFSEGNVPAVKGTVIVAPATLIQQWAEEAKKHAPTLSVLLYDGYKRLGELLGPPPGVSQSVYAHGGRGSDNGMGNVAGRDKGKGKAPPKLQLTAAQRRKRARLRAEHGLPEEDEDGQGAEADGDDEDEMFNRVQAFLGTFDLVITTYAVLQADLNVARPPKRRSRRDGVEYRELERPRSPLVQVQWYRAVEDEIQLAGVGKAAEMMSLIPRYASFAVSGTPVKAALSQLRPVLQFLGLRSITYNERIFARLFLPGFASNFVSLLRALAIRTTKAQVADELAIPPQRRVVVPLMANAVEKTYADDEFRKALLELGIDEQGQPVEGNDDPEIDIVKLRNCVAKLRQICTNPNVAAGVRERMGANFRSVEQVLEFMVETNNSTISTEERNYFTSRIRHARLLQVGEAPKLNESRDMLRATLELVTKVVDEVRKEIVEHAAIAPPPRPKKSEDDDKGKGKGQAHGRADTPSSDAEEDVEETPVEAAKRKAHGVHMGALQNRLRDFIMTQHQINFFLGDIGHVTGRQQEETEGYDAAEVQRGEYLRKTKEDAAAMHEKMTAHIARKGLQFEDLEVGYCGKPGVASADLFEQADDTVDKINQNAEMIWDLRTKIFEGLSRPLQRDLEDENAAQAYEEDAQVQGDLDVQINALEGILIDRKEALGLTERTLVTSRIAPEKRKANKAVRARAELWEDTDEEVQLVSMGGELEPEQAALKQTLLEQRKKIKLGKNENGDEERQLNLVAADLKAVADRTTLPAEYEISHKEASRLKKVIDDQKALVAKLDRELKIFMKTFNSRIEYFRQLQELSDSVTPLEYNERDVAGEIDRCVQDEERLFVRLNTLRAKKNYLSHLAKDHDEDDEEARECHICRCDFKVGVISGCAHVLCEACFTDWTKRSKECPICRSRLDPAACHRITFNRADEEERLAAKPSGERERPEYNAITQLEMDKIMAQPLFQGGFGTKIDFLCRQLLLLREQGGTKSIIFASWVAALDVIARALNANGIKFVRLGSGKDKDVAKRFTTDDTVEVFLLHGETQSSGLNLTVATNIIFVDPVLAPSIELQAVGRISRISQKNETTVFAYYIQGAIDENVLELAAHRGTSIYAKSRNAGVHALSADAYGDEAGKQKAGDKGDFIAKVDDLFALILPNIHMPRSRRVSPPLNGGAGADAMEIDDDAAVASTLRRAIAGPSSRS